MNPAPDRVSHHSFVTCWHRTLWIKTSHVQRTHPCWTKHWYQCHWAQGSYCHCTVLWYLRIKYIITNINLLATTSNYLSACFYFCTQVYMQLCCNVCVSASMCYNRNASGLLSGLSHGSCFSTCECPCCVSTILNSSVLYMTVIPPTEPRRSVKPRAPFGLVLPRLSPFKQAVSLLHVSMVRRCCGAAPERTAGLRHSQSLINIKWIYKECWVNSHPGSFVNECLAWLYEVSVFVAVTVSHAVQSCSTGYANVLPRRTLSLHLHKLRSIVV